MAAKAVLWDELSWQDIAALRDGGMNMVILPVGATEQHGLHLPTGVDTISAVAVAEGVSARTGIPLLPSLPYGCSLGHSAKWPGTLSLRPDTLAHIVREIGQQVLASGFTRMLLLNGHSTNWAPLRCGLETIRADLPEMRIALRSIWEISKEVHEMYLRDAGGNFHANDAETSVMLARRPDLVRMDRAVDEPDRSACCFFSYTVDKESVHGGTGKPTQGTPEFGRQILEACVAGLSEQLTRALKERTPLEDWNEPPPALK
jgi:creatinine amidohydrolase